MLSALKASQGAALRNTTAAAASTSCAFSTSTAVLVNAQRKAAARAAGRFKSNAPQRNSMQRKQATLRPPHFAVQARLAREEERPRRPAEESEQAEEEDYDEDDEAAFAMWAPARRRAAHPTGRLTRRQELEQSEREVRKELATLSARLSDADQREAAQRAEADLPPLDEDELQVLYDALQLPEPADAETKRLAERERKRLEVPQWQRRLLKGVEQARELLPPSVGTHQLHPRPASHRERLDSRLNALVQRLADLDVGVGTSATGQDATALQDQRADLAQRVASLLAGKRSLQREEASDKLASSSPEPSQALSFDSVPLALSAQRQAEAQEATQDSATTLFSSAEARNGVMDRIQQFLDSMPPQEGREAEQVDALPTGLITGPEWRALAVACVSVCDESGVNAGLADMGLNAGSRYRRCISRSPCAAHDCEYRVTS